MSVTPLDAKRLKELMDYLELNYQPLPNGSWLIPFTNLKTVITLGPQTLHVLGMWQHQPMPLAMGTELSHFINDEVNGPHLHPQVAWAETQGKITILAEDALLVSGGIHDLQLKDFLKNTLAQMQQVANSLGRQYASYQI